MADPSGDPQLREVLATRLGAARGLRCDPSQVVVTTGEWAALSTIADAWPEPGPVLLEEPGEPWLRALFAARGRRIVGVPADEQGLRPDRLPQTLGVPSRVPVLLSVTPAWGPVLGGTLGQDRRRELLARLHGSVRVVEDDRDAELRYDGPPPPSLAAADPLQRVVVVRGLERDLYVGARLGYLVVPQAAVAQMRAFLEAQGRGPGILEQRALARFLADGLFDRHLRRRRRYLLTARNTMLEALERSGAGRLIATPPAAGRHVVARPTEPGLDVHALVAAARRRGVLIGAAASQPGGAPDRILLGFAGADPTAIRIGIRRLGACLDAVERAGRGSRAGVGRSSAIRPPTPGSAWAPMGASAGSSTGTSSWAGIPVRGARADPR